MPEGPTTHIPHRVNPPGFEGCEFRLAPTPRRLVVFVHGWGSTHLKAWPEFHDQSWQAGAWWQESDLLFLTYDSRDRDPAAMADELREVLLAVYPRRPPGVAAAGGAAATEAPQQEYEELLLVGHSLGGAIVRRTVADLGRDTPANQASDRQRLLTDAQVRLFSPALGGFDPKGDRRAVVLKWVKSKKPVETVMTHDSAYQALRPGSDFLKDLQKLTEDLAQRHRDVRAFVAQILWANPDTIVDHHHYARDDNYSQDHVTHRTVCKPVLKDYEVPWYFVEHGRKEPLAL